MRMYYLLFVFVIIAMCSFPSPLSPHAERFPTYSAAVISKPIANLISF